MSREPRDASATHVWSRAWMTAVSGRPGPVVIALPEDMLAARTDTPALSGPVTVEEPVPSPGAMQRPFRC